MIDYSHDMSAEQRQNLSRAMFHIGRMEETKPAYAFIVAELSRLDKLNRKELDSTAFRLRQGGCQVLESLKCMIEKARDQFAKFDDMRRKAEPR